MAEVILTVIVQVPEFDDALEIKSWVDGDMWGFGDTKGYDKVFPLAVARARECGGQVILRTETRPSASVGTADKAGDERSKVDKLIVPRVTVTDVAVTAHTDLWIRCVDVVGREPWGMELVSAIKGALAKV